MQTYPLKIIMAGDSRVGKSQLSRSFMGKDFQHDSTATVGMEFSTRSLAFEKCVIKSLVWDTAGQERFESMSKAYYRDAVGALLVYDICKKESFENLKNVWLKQIREFCDENLKIIIVGNKLDKVETDPCCREVTTEEVIEYATKENFDFVEVSALNCTCVDVAFRRVVFSVAKLIPDVVAHLDLNGLPSGWIVCPFPTLSKPKCNSAPNSTTPSPLITNSSPTEMSLACFSNDSNDSNCSENSSNSIELLNSCTKNTSSKSNSNDKDSNSESARGLTIKTNTDSVGDYSPTRRRSSLVEMSNMTVIADNPSPTNSSNNNDESLITSRESESLPLSYGRNNSTASEITITSPEAIVSCLVEATSAALDDKSTSNNHQPNRSDDYTMLSSATTVDRSSTSSCSSTFFSTSIASSSSSSKSSSCPPFSLSSPPSIDKVSKPITFEPLAKASSTSKIHFSTANTNNNRIVKPHSELTVKKSSISRAASYSAYPSKMSNSNSPPNSTPPPPCGYMNYWTGDVQTEFPKEAAVPPLLHVISNRTSTSRQSIVMPLSKTIQLRDPDIPMSRHSSIRTSIGTASSSESAKHNNHTPIHSNKTTDSEGRRKKSCMRSLGCAIM